MEAGRRAGLAERMEMGIAEGIEKGKEEGIHEATISLAKSLKSQGVSIDIIMNCTQLSEDEISWL